jgi:hypothetical protein
MLITHIRSRLLLLADPHNKKHSDSSVSHITIHVRLAFNAIECMQMYTGQLQIKLAGTDIM